MTVRPNQSLRVDNTYMLFRLAQPLGPTGSMNNHIFRSKWNYQFNEEAFVPLYRRVRRLLANPAFTSLCRQPKISTPTS